MSRIRTVLLLCAFVLLGLRGRWAMPTAEGLQPPLLPPGSAEAEQDAWRLRLVQLGLATGHAPHRDPFLDAPEGRAVPWPPLFHALLGAIARHTTLKDKSTQELGSVGEAEILALAARLLPLLGMLGVLGAFFVARAVQGGVGADWAGLSAAALWAALPSIRFAESAGRIDPHALTALLSWATLGAMSGGIALAFDSDSVLKAVPWFTATVFLVNAVFVTRLPKASHDEPIFAWKRDNDEPPVRSPTGNSELSTPFLQAMRVAPVRPWQSCAWAAVASTAPYWAIRASAVPSRRDTKRR